MNYRPATAAVLDYIARQYGAEPEYLWLRTPNCAALRHGGSKKWFAALMRLLLGDGGMEPDAPTVNFVDEVITLEKVKISRTEAALRHYERMTEQDFHRELSLLRTDEERLTFAYLVMVRLLSRRYENLRDSNTPREVEAVLSQKIPGLHSVTAEIERMKYTDASADAEKMVEAIACVRRVVEDILK